MKRYRKNKILQSFAPLLFLLTFVWSCKEPETNTRALEDIAANEEVLEFMRTFDGRGALSDSSQPTPPDDVLAGFRHAKDLSLELVLAEPQVTQPVYIDFDHRGRLWVVQYNQYPYPTDLKVTSMDQHIRATFDKVPPPPGKGASGADKITFFEDTDQNGTFDKATDAIKGLNIATSVALGRGRIWVLNPPYLLAYPDANDDGLPDADPEVHLEGFGIEDTHAVANNLRWGPDGWLYGAQGSTCTANVSSAVSKNIRFDGQAIWRYHPESRIFEVYAEGGGNTFDVEIDSKGRIYSGDNGTSRGQYYKQGAYYVRNFGKHGALTNPYAFGHLSNMDLEGEKVRFTHAFVRYEGGGLPARYNGRMIAINPLQGYVQLSRFAENGSTFKIVDEERILETDDRWFRPVDITTGPDGGVYIADWYDSRLSHVDPRDTWSKSNGRIYRLGTKKPSTSTSFNLAELSSEDLIFLLSHENRWFRQQSLRVLADRKDSSVVSKLTLLLDKQDDQSALETLWALHASGGFTDDVAIKCIEHRDPFVRLWAIRFVGDRGAVSPPLGKILSHSATVEQHPEVRSQLAASAKRLEGSVAIDIVKNLVQHHDDSADPDIPLQIWWALESKTMSHPEKILALFTDKAIWRKPLVKEYLLERLMQRFSIAGDASSYEVCARMIALAPSVAEVKILMNGLQEGLRGADLVQLPPVLVNALKPFEKNLGHHTLAMSLRQKDPGSIATALKVISDRTAPIGERLTYVRIFGEIDVPEAVPVLLGIVENNESSPALKQASLQALQRYDVGEIGERIVKAYPDRLRADPGVRLAALSLFSSRPAWAIHLMNAIDRKKQPGEKFIAHTINRQDVPDQIVRQIKTLNNGEVNEMATRIWPEVRFASNAEKNRRITEVSRVLQSGKGEVDSGKRIFTNLCGACHRLFDEGGTLGPDLTGYDRKNVSDLLTNIVDPGAYVREGYVTYRITTSDGRTLSGTVAERSGKSVTVNLLTGEKLTLPEDEIKDMTPQPSMMPDNLLDGLDEQQVRDLFAYLTTMSAR